MANLNSFPPSRRANRAFLPHAAVALTLALCAGGAAAQLYSWKDETGKVHYSDQPPAGKAQARKLNPAPLNVDSSGPQNKAAAEKISAGKPKAEAGVDEKTMACEKAKADLKSLEERPRRTAKSGSGFHVLDAADRAVEEEAIRKSMEQNCR